MKSVFRFSILAAILMIAVQGCDKTPDDDPDNPDKPDVVNVVMQDVSLGGTVRDTDGNPLGGVRVTTGTLNATTASDGAFTFAKAGTVNDRIIIQFEKIGYFTLTRTAAKDDEDDDLYVEAMLYPKGNSNISLQSTFDASTAKTLQVSGITIDFPASSVVRTDGSAYSGTIRADVLYLAPDNENLWQLMPGGDLSCGISKNSDDMLIPFGMCDVVLSDNTGNPLKIKETAGVEISFPIPAAVATGAPATLSLWTFNNARGLWLDDGTTLTRQGNVYKGAVKHFSPKSVGSSSKKIIVRARVLVCDKPKAGVEVWMDAGISAKDKIAGLAPFGITNSNGYCSVYVPSGIYFDVKATYNGKTKSQEVPGSNYGLHVVLLQFDCDDDEFPEKMAIKTRKNLGGYTEYLTFDNFGERWRYDYFPDDDDHFIHIIDHKNNTQYYYDTANEIYGWYPLQGDDSEKLLIHMQTFFLSSDKGMASQGYTRRPKDEMVLGRLCSVWESSNGFVMYKWKRIRMRQVYLGNVEGLNVEVSAITEDVPASAFTETKNVSWIK